MPDTRPRTTRAANARTAPHRIRAAARQICNAAIDIAAAADTATGGDDAATLAALVQEAADNLDSVAMAVCDEARRRSR